ncbi:Serine/threonine-protein kinase PrkC [Gimesia maris]|uniref:serine/threonine protein kinase n=1 Tax=Gimesia maris TaxID=122 RepID=UPI00118914D0|nr:serine/threonine-protein kinase [Gimesia maris]QDU14842.1 Serine/threonine-protein kinase PrkC [Gimesia maris]
MTIDIAWLSSHFDELSNIESLAIGGQKFVFAANHKVDGAVVLKLIKPSIDLDHVNREILAVQRVESNRVPSILEHGQIETQLGHCFWIREKRVEGKALNEELSDGPLKYEDSYRLGIHILEALVRAEQVDIVHRDIKPQNIIKDTSGNFWLLDFGIARHLELTSLTPSAAHFGKFTAGYAPQEQFRNIKLKIDTRTDLFALGITLYESSLGHNPFHHQARDVLHILKNVEQLQLNPLSEVSSVPNNFSDFVSCLTQKRREHRPHSASEALEWLKNI